MCNHRRQTKNYENYVMDLSNISDCKKQEGYISLYKENLQLYLLEKHQTYISKSGYPQSTMSKSRKTIYRQSWKMEKILK